MACDRQRVIGDQAVTRKAGCLVAVGQVHEDRPIIVGKAHFIRTSYLFCSAYITSEHDKGHYDPLERCGDGVQCNRG
jgi:hypothetical protein